MLVWRWTGVKPPFFVTVKDGRVSMLARNQLFYHCPMVRKRCGAIETDSLCAKSLRDHIEIIVPLEHAWIREMKRLFEDDPFIAPGEALNAGGAANLASVGLIV